MVNKILMYKLAPKAVEYHRAALMGSDHKECVQFVIHILWQIYCRTNYAKLREIEDVLVTFSMTSFPSLKGILVKCENGTHHPITYKRISQSP